MSSACSLSQRKPRQHTVTICDGCDLSAPQLVYRDEQWLCCDCHEKNETRLMREAKQAGTQRRRVSFEQARRNG